MIRLGPVAPLAARHALADDAARPGLDILRALAAVSETSPARIVDLVRAVESPVRRSALAAACWAYAGPPSAVGSLIDICA